MKNIPKSQVSKEGAEALAAMQRGVDKARELSIRTGTPFYVWKDGKVVDLNAEEHKYKTEKP